MLTTTTFAPPPAGTLTIVPGLAFVLVTYTSPEGAMKKPNGLLKKPAPPTAARLDDDVHGDAAVQTFTPSK